MFRRLGFAVLMAGISLTGLATGTAAETFPGAVILPSAGSLPPSLLGSIASIREAGTGAPRYSANAAALRAVSTGRAGAVNSRTCCVAGFGAFARRPSSVAGAGLSAAVGGFTAVP